METLSDKETSDLTFGYSGADVKEFIDDLKDEIDGLSEYAPTDMVSKALIKTIKGVIDNFAGDKLIQNKENLIVEVAGVRHYCTIKDFHPKYNGDDEVLEFNIVAYPLRNESI